MTKFSRKNLDKILRLDLIVPDRKLLFQSPTNMFGECTMDHMKEDGYCYQERFV